MQSKYTFSFGIVLLICFNSATANENECTDLNHGCLASATCVDTDPDYACQCTGGTEGDGIRSCTSVDECKLGIHTCGANEVCTDTTPGFTCACEFGYSKNNDGICEDINECETSATKATANCKDGVECQNSAGGYTCDCKTGYGGTNRCEELDECALGTDDCHEGAACANTDGSFACTCAGLWTGSDGTACEDVDECAGSTAQIAAHCVSGTTECTNSVGGYTCECAAGYGGTGVCALINECELGTHDCHEGSSCSNVVDGTFTCSACSGGWTGSDGKACTDINECGNDADNNCHTNAECVNTQGSYTCTCKAGYFGNGVACDEDFCASSSTNACVENAACTPQPNSYTCDCNAGYTGNGFTNCTDIDECADSSTNNCHTNARCENADGDYYCECNAGFNGNGFTECSGAVTLQKSSMFITLAVVALRFFIF